MLRQQYMLIVLHNIYNINIVYCFTLCNITVGIFMSRKNYRKCKQILRYSKSIDLRFDFRFIDL
jgi:hypothetical protein